MPWLAQLEDDGYAHVTPIDDLRPHAPTMECWCHPLPDGNLIVHNSMDLRELYERGERRPG